MRTCNRCKTDVAGDLIGFEGSFIDWNYDLDLCIKCVHEFKDIVDMFCKTNIDTSTELTEIEKAEREPVSKAMKKLREYHDKKDLGSDSMKRYV